MILTLASFNAQSQAGDENLDDLVKDTKSDMLLVVGGGLVGAILGLSTLSFVDEPKEHTKNITIGASLGIIAGVAFVALNQANKSRSMMYGNPDEKEGAQVENANFGTLARSDWHEQNISDNYKAIVSPSSVGFSLLF